MKTYRLAILGLGRMGSTIDEEVVDYPAIARPFSVAACCGKRKQRSETSLSGSQRFELVAGADLITEKRLLF